MSEYLCREIVYNSGKLGETEKKLLKRPIKDEIVQNIWKIIEKRLKAKYNPCGSFGNTTCEVDGDYYERSGIIKETEEYNADDIGTAILKYTEEKGIIVPFGLTISKNDNVAIYKINKEI